MRERVEAVVLVLSVSTMVLVLSHVVAQWWLDRAPPAPTVHQHVVECVVAKAEAIHLHARRRGPVYVDQQALWRAEMTQVLSGVSKHCGDAR